MAKEDGNEPPPAAESSPPDSDTKTAEVPAQTAMNQETAPEAAPKAEAKPKKDATAAKGTATPATAPLPPARMEAAKLLPLPPKEVVETIHKLTTLPRVRYLSRTAQYDYYVGGIVEAKYDINKNELMVTNAPAEGGDSITCAYTQDGNMITDKKSGSSDRVKECNKLVNELTDYLTR